MIYLLEDDDSIRDFVIYTLNSQGMAVSYTHLTLPTTNFV